MGGGLVPVLVGWRYRRGFMILPGSLPRMRTSTRPPHPPNPTPCPYRTEVRHDTIPCSGQQYSSGTGENGLILPRQHKLQHPQTDHACYNRQKYVARAPCHDGGEETRYPARILEGEGQRVVAQEELWQDDSR